VAPNDTRGPGFALERQMMKVEHDEVPTKTKRRKTSSNEGVVKADDHAIVFPELQLLHRRMQVLSMSSSVRPPFSLFSGAENVVGSLKCIESHWQKFSSIILKQATHCSCIPQFDVISRQPSHPFSLIGK
jgi:hypothetical protein